jgi:hypothetical protein
MAKKLSIFVVQITGNKGRGVSSKTKATEAQIEKRHVFHLMSSRLKYIIYKQRAI